jgi:sucrose-6-phosphate hydrolase SacC (GH32 family)
MTLPRVLQLRNTPDGLRLFQQPAAITELREAPLEMKAELSGTGHQFEFTSVVSLGSAQEVGWKLLAGSGVYTTIGYDRGKQMLFVDRTKSGNVGFHKDFPARTEAPLKLASDKLELHVIVDRDSVEVFAEDGRVAITNLVFAPPDANDLQFYASGGKAKIISGKLWKLKSGW